MADGTGSVWRNRDFTLIWAGQTFSDLGTGISQLAYPLVMLAVTHSPAQAGVLAALRGLPYLLFGLLAGALADRWRRKRVMIVCELGNMVTMGSVPLALWLGHLTAAQLYITGFLAGTFYVFFNAAEAGCLPNVVEEKQLTSAVAAQETTSSASGVVAPPIGGSLFQLSHALPFLADTVSYAISAVCLLAVRPQFERQQPPAEPTRLRQDIAEGLRWLWSHQVVRTVAVMAAGLQLAIAAAGLVVIIAAQRAHASPSAIGLLFSAVGLGGVAGALIAPRLKARLAFRWMLLGTAWIQAVLWLLLAASSTLYEIAPILVLFAASMPLFGVASLSYRLAVTPDHLRGRVGTTFRLIAWSTTPVGAATAGLLLGWIGPKPTALVFGTWVVAIAAVATAAGGLRQATPSSSARCESLHA